MKTLQKVFIATILISLFIVGNLAAQAPFITTWKTNAVNLFHKSIIIPTYPGETYNYDVDWDGDGIYDEFGLTGNVTHNYAAVGTYTVVIKGVFPRIYINDELDKLKLMSIEQWGDHQWSSMKNAFKGASNLIHNATDTPDLSNVTDMNGMFENTSNFTGDISSWDVSNVTDMGNVFRSSGFNTSISSWDVSNVTNMKRMFQNSSNFNTNISSWDVSNVTDMSYMFRSSNFNRHINNWDVSNVTDMSYMFAATHFGKTLNNWDISNVTNMSYMFSDIYNTFNIDISNWDVSNVTDMSYMFYNIDYFSIDLSNWDVSNVASMEGMFLFAFYFTGDLSSWDVSNVSNMSKMFQNSGAVSNNISNWDVSNVTNMSDMFKETHSNYEDFSSWNVASVTDMSGMFGNSYSFNGELSSWDVSNVTDMSGMFAGTDSFNGDLSNWDVSNVTDMSSMFSGTDSFNGNISSWDVSNVTDMSFMFSSSESFSSDISNWNVGNVTSMSIMFYWSDFNGDLSNWDISNVTNMSSMLSSSGMSLENYDNTLIGWAAQSVQSNVSLGASGLSYCNGETARNTLINTHGWNIGGDALDCPLVSFTTTWQTDNTGSSNSTSISIPTNSSYTYNYDVDWENDGIFDDIGVTGNITHDYGAAGSYQVAIKGTFPSIYFNNGGDKEKITSIDQWGNIAWQSMNKAFYGCTNLTSIATDTPNSSAVSNMALMFSGATSFNGNLSNWDVSNVSTMAYMFRETSLFNSDLGNWDVSNVTNMTGMFRYASSFNADLSNWDVDNVSNMNLMFSFANSFNSDLSSWNVDNVSNMAYMFVYASSFNSDLSNWDVANVSNMRGMFDYASSFNSDLSNWNVANVTDMWGMFRSASSFNGNLSNWNVSNVTNMDEMFNSASSFNSDLGNWNVANVGFMINMLNNCGMSLENYDNTLIGWASQNVQQNIELGATGLTYCNGEIARNTLINTYNWTISGDALNCTPACEAPNNINLEMTEATTASFSWDAVAGANFYQVKYRKKGTTAWLTAGTANTQKNIPNLIAKKYYQYKIRTECAGGVWSDFSEVGLFFTSVCEIPTGIASVYLDNTRMRIRWDNTDEIKAKVRYLEVGTSTWYTQNSQDGQNYIYINNLTPNATYQYRVRSNCEFYDFSEYSSNYFHDLSSARLGQEVISSSNTKIYPNPTRNLLNIEFKTEDEEINMTISNHLGQVIHTKNKSYPKGIQTENIDMSSFANGYYFITIQNEERMETLKFVKVE